jgi:mono/diheme cytochrome c family protein
MISFERQSAQLRKLLLIGISGLVTFLAACQGSGAASNSGRTPLVLSTVPPLLVLDEGEIDTGQQIYADYCAECHGADLQGEADWKIQNEDGSFRAPPHDASGHTWHHSDVVLLEAIRLGGARLTEDVGGTSSMPAYGEILSEAQIQAVLTYIKSTWPEEARQVQWEQTARSQP